MYLSHYKRKRRDFEMLHGVDTAEITLLSDSNFDVRVSKCKQTSCQLKFPVHINHNVRLINPKIYKLPPFGDGCPI